MKTKENVFNMQLLKRQGLTQRHIAKKLGISRPTVKKYLDNPELIWKNPQTRKRMSKFV